MSLLRSLLFFFGAAVAAALAVLCLWVDIRVFGNDIPEVSLTEVVQESVLTVIVLVHLLLARKYAHLRYSNILIGGFFLAMLIRELDGLFDLLSHGSWVWFALLATAGSLLLPLRHLRQTLSQLAEYTRTPYYGMMISGLLAILVFSRLFGMHGLWYAVLEENYARVVKNTVEEGSESFGYMLCLTATLGYACYFRGLARQALSPQR
ncbi:TPA: transporter [Klebsiella pneumoniae subsp. pneumoniae]|nr:transporter [Klebsiella pneumoniae subsp. pneumoniae]HDU3572084.1 transporter [Klebsiella pneumoniae subsp. pneumoniae]